MPLVPDEALSSPAKEDRTPQPDDAPSSPDLLRADSESKNKRKAPPPVAAVAKRPKPAHEEPSQNEDDDRKLPAKDKSTAAIKRKAASATTGNNATGSRKAEKASEDRPTVAATTTRTLPPPPMNDPSIKRRLIGKGALVWNAHLKAVHSHGVASTDVTAMELLQQAQERLGLPPTRFPPRESPLHGIFQSTGGPPIGDRLIFGPLETCYRDMLQQDVRGEKELRAEYNKLGFRKASAMQNRIGQVMAEEQRLKKKEAVMLGKLKGWLSS